MKKTIIIIITLLGIFSFEKIENKFSLKGNTLNIEDGIILYLKNTSNNKIIDSAKVINNSFIFQTKIDKTPLQVILHNKRFSKYRFLWLENNPMTFNETKLGFRFAHVTGSIAESLSEKLVNETESLSRKERLEKAMDFVVENPNSIHSAYILSTYSTTWGKKKSKELFLNLSKENRNSEYGENISKYIEINKSTEIGDSYIDFEMENTKGVKRKLSEFKGKLVLLEFWASNCAPCRQENPNLIKTYEKYKPKGFEIFAVSQDINKKSWMKAIEKDKLPWIQVSDLKGQSTLASLIYGINGIPDNFLIDKNGIIIGRNLRGEKLNEKLAEILK